MRVPRPLSRVRFDQRPSGWVVWIFPLVAISAVVSMASERGWLLAVLTAVVYGAIYVSATVWYEQSKRLSTNHPGVDRGLTGLLVAASSFIALASLTDVALWVCGVSALGLGLAMTIFIGLRKEPLRPTGPRSR